MHKFTKTSKTRGGGKLAALLAAVAASATLTVHAADLYWTGGETGVENTEASPYNIWAPENWGGITPSSPSSDNLNISTEGTTYLKSENGTSEIGTTYFNSGDYVFTGSLKFFKLALCTNENSTASITKKSGDWTIRWEMRLGMANGTTATFVNESGNVTLSDRLCFGDSKSGGGTGTLTIKGGMVTVVPSNRDVQFVKGTGTINLDGGTLMTPKIARQGGNGVLVQNVNFNGGTLKANAADGQGLIFASQGYLNVTVNAGGGVIDCGGHAVTLNVLDGIKGTGSLTFTGGNTITLNCKVSYSGVTRVTPGTTLAVANEIAKNNILANGLVVTDIPTAGQTVFTYTNALDNADLTKVSCPCAPATTFRFSDGGKTNIVVDVVGAPDWTKYSHKFKVSFPGYMGSETLANFPVLVKISESGISGFRYADCKKSGGADLRFADADGNLLASEVDTWDTNGVSLVWVKVPSLTAATKITAYYGWNFAPLVDSKAVWANGYVAVWHLNEAAVPLADSSGRATPFMNNGAHTNKVTFTADGVAGGKAVSFAEYYNDNYGTARLEAADDPDLRGLTNFTVECWTYQTRYRDDSRDATIIGADTNWKLYQEKDSGKLSRRLRKSGGGDVWGPVTSSGLALNEWTHSTFVRNFTDNTSANSTLYLNGGSVATTAESGATATGDGSAVTHSLGAGVVFPGSIDEVRVSNVARSADWVKASHDTVTESSFSIYGPARENVKTGMFLIFR